MVCFNSEYLKTQVIEAIAQCLNYSFEEIQPGLSLDSDLGLDWISVLAIVPVIETKFGFRLPNDNDEILWTLRTVQDFINMAEAFYEDKLVRNPQCASLPWLELSG